MPWTVDVMDWLYEGERREDHRPLHTTYSVVVSNERGERFAHMVSFSTEDSRDPKGQAERLASRVEKAALAGWSPNENHWRPIQPVYGSEAYIDGGGDYEYAMDHEEREAYRRASLA